MKCGASAIAGMLLVSVSVLILGCSIAVPIAVSVTSPQNETITFDHTDDIVMAPDAMLHITISENFDSYAWVLDSVDLLGQTVATVDIDCTPLTLGVHHVSAMVTLQGKEYSKTLRFRIGN